MQAAERGLRRLDGVDQIVTDLQANVVTITPDANVAVDLAAIPRVIVDAGFRPGRMHVVAAGTVEQGPDGRAALRIRGWPSALPLTTAPTGGPDEPETRTFAVEVVDGVATLTPQ